MESNVQKMREAARHLLCVIEEMGFKPWCADDPLAIACDKLDAALAAPIKNCDKFETREDAQYAFEAQYSEHDKEVLKRYPLATLDAFCDWLYATAAERKGEGNGCEN